MEKILLKLLDFNNFANRRFIDIFTAIDEKPEREILLFSHILNAQHLWNCRINDTEYKYKVWQVHDKNDFLKIHEENQAETKRILETDDMERSISYSNTKGDFYSNLVGDMLMQVFNHGTYHRGQIAQLLRAKDINPPATDYITFKREGQ